MLRAAVFWGRRRHLINLGTDGPVTWGQLVSIFRTMSMKRVVIRGGNSGAPPASVVHVRAHWRGPPESRPLGVTASPSPSSAGHLFDLNSLSGKVGTTAAYSEKGLVFISVCGENENCASGVGKARDTLPASCLSRPGSPLASASLSQRAE